MMRLLRKTNLVAIFAAATLAVVACGDDDNNGTANNGNNGNNGATDMGGNNGETDMGGNNGETDMGGNNGQTDMGGNNGQTDMGGNNGQTDMGGGDMGPVMPSVTVSNQTLDDLTTIVSVDEVVSDGPGWMVIHQDDGSGAPGEVIGWAEVSDGTNTDVAVELTRPVDRDATETLYAMLHEDTGVMGTYEFGGGSGEDAPVMVNGSPLTEPFDATVATGTPDIRITISASSNTDYSFDSVEPARYESDTVSAIGNDPSVTLFNGWRYEIDNGAVSAHPFELITTGATPAVDVVQLSQQSGNDGTIEGSGDVNWDESDANSIFFTVGTAFSAAVDGYRCANHTGEMRGSVEYQAP